MQRFQKLATRLPKIPMRFSSTVPIKEEPQPHQVVAASLLNKFPGDSLAAKASSFTIGSSVLALLISKEIYIVDAEFFELLCLFGAYYIWYSNGKEGAIQYFANKQKQIRSVLENARSDHKKVVQERIDHIGKMSDTVKVTEELFAISKEMAEMEAEIYELKQKKEFTSQVKQVLDSWVRQEAAVRESEQRKLSKQVIERVTAQLKDPKIVSFD